MSLTANSQYGARPWIWFTFYQLLWHLLLPLAFIRLAWRARHGRAYLSHLSERLGFGYNKLATDKPIQQGAIWIHAVSVGETRAAQPLIEAYLERGESILLTHMTLNGRRTGATLFAEVIATGRLQQVYLPYDLCWAVANFIRAFQPKLGLFMETEAWPTVVFYCAQIRLPLFLVNARLSHRSARRVQWFGKAGRALFQAFKGILAQTEFDAERYRGLGVKNVQIVGNLKFDVSLDPFLVEQGVAWQQDLQRQHRLMVCAASTRDGEEVIILRAWRALLASQVWVVQPLLCLVPRHPERFSEVAELMRHADLSFCRRTEWRGVPQVSQDTQIILGDSMGEMPMYYSASNLVIMGGTLLPFGGQNLIEACAAGCPVLIGEYTYNFQQASIDALAVGAAMRLTIDESADHAQGLQESLRFLLANSVELKMMSTAALEYSLAHQGATQKILAVVERQSHDTL